MLQKLIILYILIIYDGIGGFNCGESLSLFNIMFRVVLGEMKYGEWDKETK